MGRGSSNPVVDEIPGRPVLHHVVLRRSQRMVRPMTGVGGSVTSDPEDVAEKIRPDGRHEMRSIYRGRSSRVAQRLEDEVSLVGGGGRRNHILKWRMFGADFSGNPLIVDGALQDRIDVVCERRGR